MSYDQYELTPTDFELAETYPSFVLTGIQIARVLRHDYLPRHISHVHPLSAQCLRRIYQERKQHEPFEGDELVIIDRPSLATNTTDKFENSALELGILLELQEIGKTVDEATSIPIGDRYIANYKSTLEES